MNIACYIPSEQISVHIRRALEVAGFACDLLRTDSSLVRLMRQREYDLILIELGQNALERENVFSWMNCRYGESTPIMMLSPLKSADLTALALDSGADDFLTTPTESIELIARVNAVLRRTARRVERRIIAVAGYQLDREARICSYDGMMAELTPREFTMAWLFFSTPGVYISRERIGRAIWGVDSEIACRTIEQHVYKLRKKLELGPARGVMIRTAYSQGYRLELCGSGNEPAM